MKAQLIRITPGKDFETMLFKIDKNKYGLTYTGKKYRNYATWSQLKIGDWVDGLEWKDEYKKIIDGDSPVHIAC